LINLIFQQHSAPHHGKKTIPAMLTAHGIPGKALKKMGTLPCRIDCKTRCPKATPRRGIEYQWEPRALTMSKGFVKQPVRPAGSPAVVAWTPRAMTQAKRFCNRFSKATLSPDKKDRYGCHLARLESKLRANEMKSIGIENDLLFQLRRDGRRAVVVALLPKRYGSVSGTF
jgi:hypothetical protein